MSMSLLTFTDKGIYCAAADVYIDPWKPVTKAFITHGHSDHARWGHQQYIAQKDAVPVIQYRLGDINIMGISYGETIKVNNVKFSFHPAGHIIGSSQIRVEHKGEIWVVSGDYKVENDGISGSFEPVKCHTFITECTFGLPIYTWPDQFDTYQKINEWWSKNKSEGVTSILIAYALGKAQRLMHHLDPTIGQIFTHGAIENTNKVIRGQGINLAKTTRITTATQKSLIKGNIILAPSSAVNSLWMRRFKPFSLAFASGWMNVRGIKRRRAADTGFVVSDHADWPGLLEAIKATECENVITTHGYTDVFAQYLNSKGWNARTEKTEFSTETADGEKADNIEEAE
ncbi:MAG: ligase-associated DNA damage response exonuclease [Saprospiraceae bacterium]|nr:ligase-associated DNA damage response exonuclease [Saprospiraceae bacterium]